MELRIAVIGSGYVGTVVGACFASLGHEVVGAEIDPVKLAMLESGEIPFFEPGLADLLRGQVDAGRLTFVGDPGEAATSSDIIFLCVGTPSGANGYPDMNAVTEAARAIGRSISRRHVLVTKSTVPIGSGTWLEAMIEDATKGEGRSAPVSIVSNPEFLREGNAVSDFLYPDRIVLGSQDPAAIDLVAEAYRPILEQSFPGGRPHSQPALVRTTLATAEMIKYAANAFLATKISFINEISRICEKVGADVTEVAGAIGLDSRIGPQFLNAGVGWGGSCFGKDLDALAATALDYGIEPRILRAVRKVNQDQRLVVIEKLQVHLKTLRGRRVALLGLAFKPGTDDLRDAPAIDIANRLTELGAVVSAYDPAVKELPGVPGVEYATDAYSAAERSDAVVLITDWPELTSLDLSRLAGVMRGRVLIDGRNALNPADAEAAGFLLDGVGRGLSGYVSPLVRLSGPPAAGNP